VSKKKHYLVEVVPPGPGAAREAEKVRTRLLNQVDERRNPRSRATLDQLLDRWLEVAQLEPTTRSGYVQKLELHVRPLIGSVPLSRLDSETLDSLYAMLRRCRLHCDGRNGGHFVKGRHVCDERCHLCAPLAPSTVRQIHAILSAALNRAVRWHWLAVNPAGAAMPPAPPKPDPHPPTAEQAARIVAEAWKDPDWGMLVWLAMVTGARRGELCAMRWDRVDLTAGVLEIRTSIAQDGAKTWEKDTKTHQRRRITLDEQTVGLLRVYHARCVENAAVVGAELVNGARIFSAYPDGSTWLKPESVGQRYDRMCARLGWDMNLHQLRHYSATELIAGGVDVRTVAGRLGHGGGGTTTLKVYSAFLAEADQRAAANLSVRMPLPPVSAGATTGLPAEPWKSDDANASRRIAADFKGAIACGALQPGDRLPTVLEVAERYLVAASTVQRAFVLLGDAGLIDVSRGRRAKVIDRLAMPEI